MTSPLLSVSDLSKAIGDKVLFDNVSFGLLKKERIGLIGDNGAGKSTLLKTLQGLVSADGGSIQFVQGAVVRSLAQIPVLPKGSIRRALEVPLAPLKDAIAALEADLGGTKTTELMETIERLGGWDYDHLIAQAAAEVDIFDLDQEIATLSGGYLRRVAIAQILLARPDVVFFDEPTNHLDVTTIEWLEKWLSRAHFAAIVVTHDRAFLDAVATQMAELRGGRLAVYRGNYTDYLTQRAIEEAREATTHARRLRLLAHELEWASRSPQARTTKSQARLGRIEEAQKTLAAREGPRGAADLTFAQAPRMGNTIVTFDEVSAGYAGARTLFENFSLHLRQGERWGIVGRNGTGKTSLLRLLTGDLTPRSGSLTIGKTVKMAYFDQHRADLPQDRLLGQILTPEGGDTVHFNGSPMHVSAYLKRFAFRPGDERRSVNRLSGGERSRLALAKLMLVPANLLLLDEPTNDLDLLTLQVLEDAVCSFSGTVLTVSHDRAFLNRIATGIIGFEPTQRVSPHAQSCLHIIVGDYNSYLARRPPAAVAPLKSPQPSAPTVKTTAEPQATKIRRKLTYKETQELAQMEAQLGQLEAEQERVQAILADANIWQSEPDKAQEATLLATSLTEKVERLYARWQELEQTDKA